MKTTRGRARVRRMPAGRIRRRAARALSIACALALGRDGVTRAEAQASDGNCVAAEQTAIFVAFSENAPDAVFRSDDGCLAGGGRGVGCCPGSVCKACEGDSTSRFYSCKCEPCAAGTVQPLAAQKTCVSCPAGWFNSRTGQATCEPCPVGTFSTKVGNTVGCTACGAGTSGKSTLEDYYEKTTRSWRAPATGDGSTFDSTLAATSCTDCPAGTSGGGAGDACTPCAPGYYSAARAETCTPCPVGTYSVLSGGASIDSCIPCAAGESNNATGSTECWQVCPIALLSCAADAVRDRGAYDALELARARPRISYTDDGIDDYRARLCKTGCETFGTDHWCASFGLPTQDDCKKYAPPPPPPPAPPGDVADPNATAANASAAS
uniref:Tyrosine-protein kinase ephrin type A/B receptor-like domain-containing protein n=1 Tax=Ostreococcus sp. 'lucimarinus' TaxID=242159 RepID=A0A7R9T527_9CHLO